MRKIFHGWRIVAAGGALQFLQNLLLNQAFGAYLAVLVEERGWSKTALAGAATLKSTEAAALGPVLGWAADRFGARWIMRVGVVLFGSGFMLLSQIDSIFTFYAAFIVIALGACMCSNFTISITIIQWFETKRARALSLVQFGMALGGMFVFFVAWSIQAFGWRATAFGSGVIILLVGWPMASAFLTRPEDHGQTIDGLPPVVREPGKPAPAVQHAFTAREALKTSSFWLISLGHAFALLVVAAVNVHAIAHVKEGLSYSLAAAAFILTLVTGGQFLGILLGWVIGDRWAKRKVAAACLLMHAAGLLMLTYSTSYAMLVISALVHGIGWGLRGPYMHAMRADYFGRRSIGVIMGLSNLVTVFGQIGGPLIAGAFADLTGDYRVGFTILAVLSAVGSLFFWLAKPPKSPLGA